jgi:hypothetical protein
MKSGAGEWNCVEKEVGKYGPQNDCRLVITNVTSLLTGHNTLRRHLYIMGLTVHCVGDAQQRRRPQPILYECEALVTLRHIYLGSFLFDPEDVRSLSLGAIWNCIKGTGLP